jgi:hypothetical protein
MTVSKLALRVFSALILLFAIYPAWGDDLKSADAFAVLAGSTVTNAGAGVLGATVIIGNLGVYPGSTCTGFTTCPTIGPGTIVGTVHLADGVALQAQKDLTNAYTTLGGLASTLEPANLTGLTLGPGVYEVPAAASNLTGTLKLSDGGIAGSSFIFLTDSTLITSPGSLIDVSALSPSDKLFWVVRSSATLGDNTVFEGNILALTSITFDPGATIGCGRALAQNGQVAFAGQDATTGIENRISIGCENTTGAGGGGFIGGPPVIPAPEPATFVLFGVGIFCLIILKKIPLSPVTA